MVLVFKGQIGYFLKPWMCLVLPQTSGQVSVIYHLEKEAFDWWKLFLRIYIQGKPIFWRFLFGEWEIPWLFWRRKFISKTVKNSKEFWIN